MQWELQTEPPSLLTLLVSGGLGVLSITVGHSGLESDALERAAGPGRWTLVLMVGELGGSCCWVLTGNQCGGCAQVLGNNWKHTSCFEAQNLNCLGCFSLVDSTIRHCARWCSSFPYRVVFRYALTDRFVIDDWSILMCETDLIHCFFYLHKAAFNNSQRTDPNFAIILLCSFQFLNRAVFLHNWSSFYFFPVSRSSKQNRCICLFLVRP